MVRDNTYVEEIFEWVSKAKLYNIIEKYKKNNTLLLSGDVHTANYF